MAILVREQIFRDDSVLELRQQPPFTCQHVIAWQVPPEIIVQVLAPAIDLPAAENVKRLTIHDEHARWAIGAVLTAAAERSSGSMILWIFAWVGSGFVSHDINPRGAEPRDDQVAPLEEG